MSKHEQAQVTEAQAQRELRALDAALSGGSVDREHEPLAELALALRADRAQPSKEFAHALDARAAEGFRSGRGGRHGGAHGRARSGRIGSPAERTARRAPHRILSRPALAAGALVVVLAAFAVPLALSSHTHGARKQTVRAGGAEMFTNAPATGVKHDDLKAAGSGSSAAAPSAQASGSAGTGSAGAASAPGTAGGANARAVEHTATLELGVAAARSSRPRSACSRS